MKKEERVSKILFGVILIAAAFIPGGRWVAMGLGIVFLLSALLSGCAGCGTCGNPSSNQQSE